MSMIRSRPVPTSLIPASKEALLLLLLATGMRVDDALKLSFVCELEESTPSRLVLFFLDKRKCKIRGAWSTSVTIKEYEQDERLCPARAILRMLDISASTRDQGVKTLFISSSGGTPALYSMRRWIVDLLQEAGISGTPGSCRSAASSRAFADGVPIDEILNAAGWSSQDTFFRFYQREVSKTARAARPVNLMPVL
jgi:integrase